MSICLIDTTVFCNVVPVPGRDQDRTAVLSRMATLRSRGVELLLPLAAIVETGNHIARCGDGRVRRQTAARCVRIVKQAIEGDAAITPPPFCEPEEFLEWLSEFPDAAMAEKGFGDFSIIKEFERQCALHPARRVFIWASDAHLRGYDRPA